MSRSQAKRLSCHNKKPRRWHIAGLASTRTAATLAMLPTRSFRTRLWTLCATLPQPSTRKAPHEPPTRPRKGSLRCLPGRACCDLACYFCLGELMRTAMRPRYYCDHCNKGNGSPSAMKRHESGCTKNPQRICGMCKIQEEDGGPEAAPSRDELVKIMDADGFKAMCAAANDCPACILSALRTKNYMDDETGPWVHGPEDGRQAWSYKTAKESWWSAWNSAKQQEHY